MNRLLLQSSPGFYCAINTLCFETMYAGIAKDDKYGTALIPCLYNSNGSTLVLPTRQSCIGPLEVYSYSVITNNRYIEYCKYSSERVLI